MTYLSKFDSLGRRITSYPMDASISTKQIKSLKSEGYIEISEDDWNSYVGNCGAGKNGTGYVRGADGKPTDAPAHTPSTDEKKQAVIAQYEADKDGLMNYYADAALHDDTELMADLKAEMLTLDEKFAEDMKELEG